MLVRVVFVNQIIFCGLNLGDKNIHDEDVSRTKGDELAQVSSPSRKLHYRLTRVAFRRLC